MAAKTFLSWKKKQWYNNYLICYGKLSAVIILQNFWVIFKRTFNYQTFSLKKIKSVNHEQVEFTVLKSHHFD